MSYKSKGGRTEIKVEKYEALMLSYDGLPYDKKLPVLLVRVPLVGNSVQHHYFTLSRDEAKIMSDWLLEYLKDKKHFPKKISGSGAIKKKK
jgi:hypothetical protein